MFDVFKKGLASALGFWAGTIIVGEMLRRNKEKEAKKEQKEPVSGETTK
jgi:hypothetical protein